MIPVWYILKIRNNDACYIRQELSLRGIKTYYPMIKHSDNSYKWRFKPMFYGYMFIQIADFDESTPILNRVRGIIDFLREDGTPAKLPDHFMDRLQDQVDQINQQEGVWRTYNIGDKVLLESYGLSTVGTVVQHSMSDKTRVRILIDFMGKEIKAEVNWFSLTPYESSNKGIKTNTRRTRGRNRPIKTYTTV